MNGLSASAVTGRVLRLPGDRILNAIPVHRGARQLSRLLSVLSVIPTPSFSSATVSCERVCTPSTV